MEQAKRLRQQLIEQGVIKAEDIGEDEGGEAQPGEKKQKSMVVRNKKKKTKEAK